MNDIAIKVDSLYKSFKLPHEQRNSVKSLFLNVFSGTRTFEKQQVLQDIDFEIKKGEFFGIVGRNGSGKSTLLKLLSGIYFPDKGSVTTNGKLTPFIELGVGFSPELTGRENVFLNGALLGFNRSEVEAMYQEIVDFAEMERFMDQKLKNYSSGMQVRLAFSIAIQAKSDILLLDEVLAVGDAAFQRKCFDYFMDLKKNKQTVILVTHDMSAVRQYCDRAVMIEKGKIVHEGDPNEIAQEYQRLFNEEAEKSESEDDTPDLGDRWGEGDLVATSVSTAQTSKEVELTVTYEAKKPVTDPVYGFTIYGPSGINIFEGNTKRLKHKTKSLKIGESVDIVWRVPNIFTEGKHSVSVACCDESLNHFYDWLNGAVTFNIHREYGTAGVTDPPIAITERKGKGAKN